MKTALLVIINFVFLAGCANDNQPTTGDDPTRGLQANLGIDVSGTQRNYHLYLPQNPTSASIVLLLHGNRGSADQLLGLNGLVAPNKAWLDIAARENLILIVPDGAVGPEGHQGWNDCRTDAPNNPDTDDVQFINDLIDAVSSKYQVSSSKVFSVGISNGGMMSMRLADEIPKKLQAFAAMVASRPINTKCPDAVEPVSALIMNGTADPILPYNGGHIRPLRGELFSTADAVSYWINRNQTNTAIEPVELEDLSPNDNSTVKVFDYNDGINNTRVKHFEVVGGGHTEPSIKEQYGPIYKLVVGEQNNDFESAEAIWAFFDSIK